MIFFELRMYMYSYRWLPPTLVLFVFLAINIGGGGSVYSRAASLFAGYLLWGIWTTISLGNLPSQATRDLLAARAGSTSSRHHAVVGVTSVSGAFLALLPSLYALVFSGETSARPFLGMLLSCSSGFAIGGAAGTWLHEPIVTNKSFTVFGAIAVFLAVLLFSPLTNTLSRLSDGEIFPVATLAALSAALLVVSTVIAGFLAQRRAAIA